MQLGWIDFSKTERNKILSVLDLLSQDGTLDELGIAPVRDGFANLIIPHARNIDKSAGTKKRHLRLSSKMAFFCSYQSETLTAKPPLKK